MGDNQHIKFCGGVFYVENFNVDTVSRSWFLCRLANWTFKSTKSNWDVIIEVEERHLGRQNPLSVYQEADLT